MDDTERITVCIECRRRSLQDLPECPSCGAPTRRELARPRLTKGDLEKRRLKRNAFHRRRALCHECPHYETGVEKDGCQLMTKPCDVEKGWLDGLEDWCPVERTRVRPQTPKGQRIKGLALLTSFSPHQAAAARQRIAYESWLEWGITICAVQASSEMKALIRDYPDALFYEGDESKYQSLDTVLRTVRDIGIPTLLTNSDIEIYGPSRGLTDHLDDKTLVIGVRHNYEHDHYATAEEEPSGLDAFVLTPSMTAAVPASSMNLGRPMWDYFLPYCIRERGYRIKLLAEPLFFHKQHPRLWGSADWSSYDAEARRVLGHGVRRFRRSLSPAEC